MTRYVPVSRLRTDLPRQQRRGDVITKSRVTNQATTCTQHRSQSRSPRCIRWSCRDSAIQRRLGAQVSLKPPFIHRTSHIAAPSSSSHLNSEASAKATETVLLSTHHAHLKADHEGWKVTWGCSSASVFPVLGDSIAREPAVAAGDPQRLGTTTKIICLVPRQLGSWRETKTVSCEKHIICGRPCAPGTHLGGGEPRPPVRLLPIPALGSSSHHPRRAPTEPLGALAFQSWDRHHSIRSPRAGIKL